MLIEILFSLFRLSQHFLLEIFLPFFRLNVDVKMENFTSAPCSSLIKALNFHIRDFSALFAHFSELFCRPRTS